MATDTKTLEILIRSLFDRKGTEEAKAALGELGDTVKGAGSLVGEISSLIGVGLGGAAVSGVLALVNEFINLRQREAEFAEETRRANQLLSTQEAHWSGLASTAGKFFDVVRLGMTILPTIQKLSDELTASQQKQLTFTQQLADILGKGLIGGKGPIQLQQSREEIEKLKELIRVLKDYREGVQNSQKSIQEWQRLQSGPLAESISVIDQKMADLKTKIDAIDPIKALPDAQKAKQLATQLVELNREYGVWADRRERLQKQADKENESEDASAGVNQKLTAVMREQSAVLQSITQQRQLIEASPFLSADQRQSLLLSNYVNEIQQLQGAIAALNAQKTSGLLDPAQLALVQQKTQGLVFEYSLLSQKIAAIKAPFTTELVNWANQFGTASQQAAHALTGTLGTAIGGVSQAMTGLIFGTQNWRQAMAQTAESIVADLIRIALQFVMSRTIMAVLNQTFARTEGGIVNQQASAAFAAWEPAAIAASTASYGAAAGFGLAAFLAAVAGGEIAGIASAAGGAATMHSGGRVRRMHSGGLAHDEVPIIAQQGEVMIQRDVAQQPGVTEFLLALNSGMLFHAGGVIAPFVAGQRYHGGLAPAEGSPRYFNMLAELMGWSPPANLDQNVPDGPIVETPTDRSSRAERMSELTNEFGYDFESFARLSGLFGNLINFGYFPFGMVPAFGPTVIPTNWVNYPGVGAVPMAVPVGWTPTATSPDLGYQPFHPGAGVPVESHHSGGIIGAGRSLSLGSLRLPRFHTGGGVGLGGSARLQQSVIHVNNFTDMKALVKAMASQKGRRIIVDTVRGNRLDLGF